MVCEKISTLLSHFIQVFHLVLISMNLNETKKQYGVEVTNRAYTKGGQRMADRWGRPA